MLKSLLSKLIITNVKTGKPSYTLTAFIIGTVIVNIKLLLSGFQITETIKAESFSGMDYAAAMAALAALHIGNKSVTATKKEEDKE